MQYYYTPKLAIWALSNLIGPLLLYYDFILHWFTFYGAFKLLILHGFTFYGGFDWFVSSLWSTAVLQVHAAQLTLLAVMLHLMDSLNFGLKSLHSGRNSAEVSSTVWLDRAHLFTSSIFIDIFAVFPRSASLARATFQQGRQARVGQSFLSNNRILWKLVERWWKAWRSKDWLVIGET